MNCAVCGSKLRPIHRRGCPLSGFASYKEQRRRWSEFNQGRDECHEGHMDHGYLRIKPPTKKSSSYKLGWDLENR